MEHGPSWACAKWFFRETAFTNTGKERVGILRRSFMVLCGEPETGQLFLDRTARQIAGSQRLEVAPGGFIKGQSFGLNDSLSISI